MDSSKQPGIKFTGVHLLSLEFKIKGKPESMIPTGLTFETKAELSEDGKALDLYMITDLFGDIEEPEKPPIDFNFVLHAGFEAAEQENLSLAEFARRQAPAHLIPYVRELIANITTRSVLPTLNLGPINVISMIESGQATFELQQRPKDTQEI